MEYKYLGDRQTAANFKGILCNAVRTKNGKCIRGKNANMLIEMETGKKVVVIARLLRKIKSS